MCFSFVKRIRKALSRQKWPNEDLHFSSHLVIKRGSLAHILGEAFSIFTKYVKIFGLYFVATEGTPDEKLRHGASVFYQYIDNEGNGAPDNLLVYKKMLKLKATMVMFRDEHEQIAHKSFFKQADIAFQVLRASETAVPGRFDVALEECFHLLSYAYSKTFPRVFGLRRGSFLANCCDKARGGYFEKVPAKYPRGAWFTYYDNTCDYACQINEYVYWAMTSLLGAQKNRKEILNEWRLNTPELLKKHDPQVYALLTDKKFRFPTKLPKFDIPICQL